MLTDAPHHFSSNYIDSNSKTFGGLSAVILKKSKCVLSYQRKVREQKLHQTTKIRTETKEILNLNQYFYIVLNQRYSMMI